MRQAGSRRAPTALAARLSTARAVLVEHVEEFAAVALPPAAWMAADQDAGQPGGQRGGHRGAHVVAVRWRPMRTICCMLVSCSVSTVSPAAVIW